MSTVDCEFKGVCVIGAGSSGLIAARELSAAGIEDYAVFEIQSGCGGLYLRDNYENACHTSSVCYTSFACYPPKTVTQCIHYSVPEYVQYLDNFIDHFGLREHIFYETEVVGLTRSGDKWQVTIRRLRTNEEQVIMFDAIIAASGTHTHHKDPRSHEWLDGFEGDVIHSSDFRSSKVYENKRVVICGGGESASDVSIHTSKVASQTWIAMRKRTGHITPRGAHLPENDHDSKDRVRAHLADPDNVPPDVAFDLDLSMAVYSTSDAVAPSQLYKDCIALSTSDFFNGMKINIYNKSFVTNQFGCKNAGFSSAIARYGCIPKPPVCKCEGKRVTFEDGTVAEDVDSIILCVGYDSKISFLDEELTCKLKNPRNLLKHTVHPDLDNVFVLGFVRPAFGNIPTLAELQAKYVAQLLTGAKQRPKREDMLAKIEADRIFEETQFTAGKKVKALTNFYHFANDLADLTGVQPDYAKLLFHDPMLFLKMFAGQFSVYFYRLADSRTPEEYAKYRKIIMDMPLANTWNMDLAIFITSFHLSLLLGGIFPKTFGLKGTTCLHKMSPASRRLCAVLLFLNPLYVLFVVLPCLYVTIVTTLLIQFNSIRFVSNFDYLRGLDRPSYYVAKSEKYDWLHMKLARFQLTIFFIAMMPFDMISTALLQRHLTNLTHIPLGRFMTRQANYRKVWSKFMFD